MKSLSINMTYNTHFLTLHTYAKRKMKERKKNKPYLHAIYIQDPSNSTIKRRKKEHQNQPFKIIQLTILINKHERRHKNSGCTLFPCVYVTLL